MEMGLTEAEARARAWRPPAGVVDGQASETAGSNTESSTRAGTLALKRVLDIAGALFCIVALAPLWIAIAIAIKADSPGPVLFRQPRPGRNGRVFEMIKFRTMIRDADARKLAVLHLNDAAPGLFKISGDPRVTRIGRFLRSTSLDELPQVINVLAGTMSLVGPRPLLLNEDALIRGRWRQRSTIRPGMTGVWQVAGASRIPIHEMVKLDAGYVDGLSIWGDLKILAGTVKHVVRRQGI